jgi:hypothetical protein
MPPSPPPSTNPQQQQLTNPLIEDQPKTSHYEQLTTTQTEVEVGTEQQQQQQQPKPKPNPGSLIAYLCMNSMDSLLKSLTCVC